MGKFSISRKSKIITILLAVLVTIFLTFMCAFIKQTNEKIQWQMKIDMVIAEDGNYNSNKLILQGKNLENAENLASQLGATLRKTADGSFAVLTLNMICTPKVRH